MKANELREKSQEQLQAALVSELEEQFKLRMKRASGDFSQTHLFKEVRRNIARIKTVLNDKASVNVNTGV